MPVTFIQTNDFNRLDVAYYDHMGEGSVEGYIQRTDVEELPFYQGHALNGTISTDHLRDPVMAAALMIPNYWDRELAYADHCIAALHEGKEGLSTLALRLLPRRIEHAMKTRQRILDKEF